MPTTFRPKKNMLRNRLHRLAEHFKGFLILAHSVVNSVRKWESLLSPRPVKPQYIARLNVKGSINILESGSNKTILLHIVNQMGQSAQRLPESVTKSVISDNWKIIKIYFILITMSPTMLNCFYLNYCIDTILEIIFMIVLRTTTPRYHHLLLNISGNLQVTWLMWVQRHL